MIDRDLIRSKIQEILNKSHKLAPKKVIKETPEGLAFADPIGGDSMKNPYTKRAHLYWDSFYVICYDDDGYKMPFTKFCSTFGVDLASDQRLAIYDHIDNNITYNDCEDEFLDSTFSDLISVEELEKVLNSLQINHDQLICLGILSGTDFNPGGVKGIGPKKRL